MCFLTNKTRLKCCFSFSANIITLCQRCSYVCGATTAADNEEKEEEEVLLVVWSKNMKEEKRGGRFFHICIRIKTDIHFNRYKKWRVASADFSYFCHPFGQEGAIRSDQNNLLAV